MSNPGALLIAARSAFVVATVTAPVGVSGAVFLMSVQLSILHTPSPSVTPTNLLYNLFAIPGGLLRYRRHAGIRWLLARLLIVGTIPGTIVGAIIRVRWLSDLAAFLIVVAGVLIPLGIWLLVGRPAARRDSQDIHGQKRSVLIGLAVVVGVIGGIYGIGGGSFLAPILVGLGFAVADVAAAALAATLVTSIAGLATYIALSLGHHGNIAPDYPIGIAMGLGGFAGTYAGAALQPWLPERLMRRGLGAIAVGIGVHYLLKVLG